MKRKAIIGVVVVGIIAIIVGIGTINRAKDKGVSVKAGETKQGEIEAYLSTTGIVKSQNVKEYYGIQAKIKKANVKVGDTVKKGDVLISYETEELNTAVKQSEIQYSNAKLQLEDSLNQNKEIDNKLNDINSKISTISSNISNINNEISKLGAVNDPLTSSSQIQNLKQQKATLEQQKNTLIQQRDSVQKISSEKMKQLENSVKLAKLNLDSAKTNLSKNAGAIVATNDGVVTELNAAEGAVGNMSMPAVVVQNLSELKTIISLGKYDASNVKLNQTAVIKNIKNKYTGKVVFIAPTAEKSKNSVSQDAALTAEVAINEKNPNLKIDLDADVDILLAEKKNVLKVPAESVKTDKSGKSYVFVIQDNKVIKKEVISGIQSDTEVEVVKGLEKGQKVVLSPTEEMKDGQIVSIDDSGVKEKKKLPFRK